ncbi:MAG: efflux RND transporter periplasmic adaptor subunit [Verrucomicrobia bacterium]|nr:efflux RND transporter periplasmic adaptor subunit [Verrucomicrobiota bacterium]
MSVQTTNLKAKPAPPSSPKRSRFLRVVIWIAVLGVFALGFYLVSMPKEAPKGRVTGATAITTIIAKKGNIGDYLDAIGTVTPVYTASIFSQVTGVVVKVNYQEGQITKVGDPLVDIDDRQYQAQLIQAQGALQRDQNVLAQAEMDLQRYRDAWARNGVAKQTLDDQEKLVLQEQGTVKNDEGAVQYDQLQVEYCHIKAPIAGRVGLRPVDPGNLVTAGTSSSSSATPLVVITQIQPITVVFTIAEDNLGQVMEQLRGGSKLTVDVYDRAVQKKLAAGELIAVDNQIDTTTGTVKVRASFPNDDFALFPNQFVNARLLVKTLQDVTLVPSSAIQQNGQTSFVYVIEDNVAHLKNIKPGVSDGGLTQVDGINPGEVLADSSFDKLQDNTKITVATGKPAATQTPGGQQKQGSQQKQGNEKPGSEQSASGNKGT